ncbi:MAG: GNAT family N-acetyltransferase [Gemmatimonadales bacterium]|jgi:GNAT superfamily N-acetyltransferase
MLFATTTLAARIERADCSLLSESVRAVGRLRPEADVMVKPVGGGVATYSGEGSPLNKVAGLGFEGPVTEAQLAEVERLYADRHTPVQVELSCLADPAVGATLTSRGYQLVGFENVLGRELSTEGLTSYVMPPDVAITVSDDQDFATWLDTVVEGFATPDGRGVPSHESFPKDALERVMSDMAQTEGLVRYLAVREGEPAGGGSMRLSGGIAQLCGAATLPEHRRRGVQTALLARRLADAAHAGCDVAVVTTQPGSKSQENVQRRGFELLYTRAILVREPVGS